MFHITRFWFSALWLSKINSKWLTGRLTCWSHHVNFISNCAGWRKPSSVKLQAYLRQPFWLKVSLRWVGVESAWAIGRGLPFDILLRTADTSVWHRSTVRIIHLGSAVVSDIRISSVGIGVENILAERCGRRIVGRDCCQYWFHSYW